jgi:hypothetical protein
MKFDLMIISRCYELLSQYKFGVLKGNTLQMNNFVFDERSSIDLLLQRAVDADAEVGEFRRRRIENR